LSALRHPNILLFMGATTRPAAAAEGGADAPAPLEGLSIVSEYLCGGSLWDFLHSPSVSYSWDTALVMAADIAKGVAHLHGEGIIHRDLKSANLLLDRGGTLKVADFGLARVKAHTFTMTGQCGTVQWMAPEVLGSQRYAEPADTYSYGIVLWEIATRRCPYEGMQPIQVAMAVLHENQRPNHSLVPARCARCV
jgi:serine/threonine protein kinase